MSLHGSFSKDDTHKRRDSGIHFHHVYMENPCESPGPLRLREKVCAVHRFLHMVAEHLAPALL